MKEAMYADTFTSLRENEGQFHFASDLNQRRRGKYEFTVIDFPGAERLRSRMMSHPRFDEIDCVLFLIDASTIKSNLHDIALYIVDILLTPSFVRRDVPLLLAFNKLDLVFDLKRRTNTTAVPPEDDDDNSEPKAASKQPLVLDELEQRRVKEWVSILESDITSIRNARIKATATVSDHFEIRPASVTRKWYSSLLPCLSNRPKTSRTSAEDESQDDYTDLLGDPKRPFSFKHLSDRVHLTELCAATGQLNLLYDEIYALY